MALNTRIWQRGEQCTNLKREWWENDPMLQIVAKSMPTVEYDGGGYAKVEAILDDTEPTPEEAQAETLYVLKMKADGLCDCVGVVVNAGRMASMLRNWSDDYEDDRLRILPPTSLDGHNICQVCGKKRATLNRTMPPNFATADRYMEHRYWIGENDGATGGRGRKWP